MTIGNLGHRYNVQCLVFIKTNNLIHEMAASSTDNKNDLFKSDCSMFQRDSTIAKLLFSGIFEGIFDSRNTVKTERELDGVTDQINTSLNNVLTDSTLYFPPFIACILVSVPCCL